MPSLKTAKNHYAIAFQLLRLTLIVGPVAVLIGSSVAFFLWALDLVTSIRWEHPFLLYLLPLAGVAIVWSYSRFGKGSDAGNDLILDEIHTPGGGVPARMAPFVLLGTLATHLFGGSAGREGTAVQMGGSIAAFCGRTFKISKIDMRIVLMAGVAAGFGAVFGTPVAGAVFAMEVLTIGRIQYDALLPCLIAALIGHVICIAWGIQHTHYTVQETVTSYYSWFPIDLNLLWKVILVGIVFGLVSVLFSKLVHGLKDACKKYISFPLLIPFIGGAFIIGLSLLLNTTDYLGLGVNAQSPRGVSLVNAFTNGGVTDWSWLWKLIFTVITLSAGFKGGEVTPLFFIGAALGNTLAILLHAPVDLFAALGFIAVFAGAANTPLACIVLGVELFGAHHLVYYAVACFTAYYFSGHTGIYSSQKVVVKKHE